MSDSLELRALARLLRRWWWLIVFPTLAAALAALPALSATAESDGGFTTLLHYSAARQQDEQLPESDLQDVWLASELTVNALSAWARTESFRREISVAPGVQPGDTDALGIACG